MTKSYRRYEILLPLRFNDARQFFTDFKEDLKQRFQQIDIWITTYPIDGI